MSNGNAFWKGAHSRHIEQRIVVEGDLELVTPANFGAGASDDLADMPLLVDPLDGFSPLLTGATITGALRGYLRTREKGYRTGEQANRDRQTLGVTLFGATKGDDDGEQSALVVEDSLGQNAALELRDGVTIEGKTRTAKENGLYDIHVWRAGTTFPLRFELLISRPHHLTDEEQDTYRRRLKEAFATALEGFNDGGITLGAKKQRGYGQIRVKQWRVKLFDLLTASGLCDWVEKGHHPLTDNDAGSIAKALGLQNADLPDERRDFRVEATLALDSSLLIRSGGSDSGTPDRVHLKSWRPDTKQAVPILSGTSLAGALRARAYRIANTLDKSNKAKALIYKMFGPDMNDKEWAKGKTSQERVQASRLLVKETVVENGRTDLVQNRVSIDRFTGGARETALFNQQPLFARDDTRVTVDLRLLNPQAYEIGLLLLLLKDLWTGDLPLGGESSVGRGRLKGKEAKLTYRNGTEQRWQIVAVGEQLEISSDTNSTQQALEDFVMALNDHLATKNPT